MAATHDRTSGSLAGSSAARQRAMPRARGFVEPVEAGKDPLSGVLRTVKLTGALFFLVDASSPWGVEIPHAREFAPIILPGAQHVVSYHIVLKGSAYASVAGVLSAVALFATWLPAHGATRVDPIRALRDE